MLKSSQAPVTSEKHKEAPLSAEEVTRLKAAFRFLREHRQILKLRVNAQEDLLLNGKREPDHRGVCQHLLAKVDKARVLQASERLKPTEATKLLAGVIRFAPELPYILRFLECVRDSSGQQSAATALTHALSNIDFGDASEAQVRQLLVLICDVYPERELPVFLLGLLYSAPFREAFDRSSEDLPEALASILVPLREVHRLLSENRRHKSGRGARLDPDLLSQGAVLLLRVNHQSLLELPPAVKKRLFYLLCDSGTQGEGGGQSPPTKALLALFESLRFSAEEITGASLGLCSLLLRNGSEREARQVLRKAIESSQGTARFELEQRLELLDQPRLGPIAIAPSPNRDRSRRGEKTPEKPKDKRSLPPPGRFYNAVHLHDGRELRVLYIKSEHAAAFDQSLRAWRELLLPGVQLPVTVDIGGDAVPPFVAVERIGGPLAHQLRRASDAARRLMLLDLCRLKVALDGQGLSLPDGNLRRFSVDAAGHVWLSDASDVSTDDSTDWLKDALARFEAGEEFSFSSGERSALEQADTPLQIAQALGLV